MMNAAPLRTAQINADKSLIFQIVMMRPKASARSRSLKGKIPSNLNCASFATALLTSLQGMLTGPVTMLNWALRALTCRAARPPCSWRWRSAMRWPTWRRPAAPSFKCACMLDLRPFMYGFERSPTPCMCYDSWPLVCRVVPCIKECSLV